MIATASSLHGIDSLSIAHARATLSEVVGRARHAKSPTVLTSRGRPVAAVVSIEDLALIEDEIDRLMAAEARPILASIRSGKTKTIPHAEVVAQSGPRAKRRARA